MFGRAAMAGVPIQGMATDKREACVSTEVGQPVSGDQAGDAASVLRGGKDFPKGLRVCLPGPGQHEVALLVEHADRQSLRVQVEAAGQWVLGGVKSPEVSSFGVNLVSHDEQTTVVCEGGGLNKYQTAAGDGLQRPLRSRFQPRLSRSVVVPSKLGVSYRVKVPVG